MGDTVNRWKMNRLGLVNFWLYDEEEFYFDDVVDHAFQELIKNLNSKEKE